MILRLAPGGTPIDIALDNTETEIRIEYTEKRMLRIEGTVVDEHDGKTHFMSTYPKIKEEQ